MVPCPSDPIAPGSAVSSEGVDRLIAGSTVDLYGLHGLQALRDELRDLSEKHSHELLVVLMAGFALSRNAASSPYRPGLGPTGPLL